MLKNTLCISLILFAIAGCTHDKRYLPQPVFACDYNQQNLKYSGLIKTIIDNNCNTCHSLQGPGVGDFSTYAGIRAKIDAGTFRQRVIVKQDMPLGTALSPCDLSALHDWLNANAPE